MSAAYDRFGGQGAFTRKILTAAELRGPADIGGKCRENFEKCHKEPAFNENSPDKKEKHQLHAPAKSVCVDALIGSLLFRWLLNHFLKFGCLSNKTS